MNPMFAFRFSGAWLTVPCAPVVLALAAAGCGQETGATHHDGGALADVAGGADGTETGLPTGPAPSDAAVVVRGDLDVWFVGDEVLAYLDPALGEGAALEVAGRHHLALIGRVLDLDLWQFRSADPVDSINGLETLVADLTADPAVQAAFPNLVYGDLALYPDDGYGWNGVSDDGGGDPARAAWEDADVRNQVWALDVLELPAAWQISVGGDREVSVVDSGFAPSHDDFEDPASGESRADLRLARIADGGDALHGTHVAGTIGASGDNGRGIAGVNWNAPLLLYESQAFESVAGGEEAPGPSSGTTISHINAIRHAVNDRENALINFSMGLPWGRSVLCDDEEAEKERFLAWDAAAWRPAMRLVRERGGLIVAAAGNSGDVLDPECRPDSRFGGGPRALKDEFPDNVLVVASVGGGQVSRAAFLDAMGAQSSAYFFAEWSDVWNSISPFSSGWGDADIAAPGAAILSLCPASSCPDSDTVYDSGTSMSAPLVTGIASLVWELRPAWSSGELKQHLLATARSHGSPVYLRPRDSEQATQLPFFVVDAAAAIRFIDSEPGCTDLDRDGYGAREASGGVGLDCRFREVDCDDTRGEAHPGADELCNGLDDNCNGIADEDGICGDEIASAPVSGVVPDVFDTDGGTFRLSVSPLDPNGDLITNGVTTDSFEFRNITVARLEDPDATVANGAAEPTEVEIIAPSSAADGVSVMLLLDSSGSMSENDSTFLRVQAARDLVRQLGVDDEVAAMDFGAGVDGGRRAARLLSGFTTDSAAVDSALNAVTADGGTPLYAATLDALEYLAAEATLRPTLVVLSDGIAEDDERLSDAADLARAEGIPIYAVGLGTSIDFSGMETLAAQADGAFALAIDASGLGALFEAIGVAAGAGRVVVHGRGTFAPPLGGTGRHLVSGVLRTLIGRGTVDTPFSFSVDVR